MKAGETLRAPAKLNLSLEVLARRPDGLHGVRSVMVPVDLFDELLVSSADRFQFSCDVPDLQADNVIERALQAMGLREAPVRIELRKRIPVGGGMGGGSSDAAAVLLAAQNGAFGPVDAPDWLALARSLGSDVPFFLVQTAALVEGTGDRVTALGTVPPWHAVVIRPPASISTAWAYGRMDARERRSRPRSSGVSLQMAQALQRREFDRVVSLLSNDFADVALQSAPLVAQALDMLRAAGCERPVLTGSGSCVFGLAQTLAQREEVAARVQLPPGFQLYRCSFWNGQAWRSAA